MKDHAYIFLAGARLSRDQYVETCLDIGVTPVADADLGSYGDKYGSFFWPQYKRTDPDHIHLAARQARFFALRDECPPDPVPTTPEFVVPEKQGQLWEPCKCGSEPVYMPLHLCADCWPQ